MIAYTGTCFLFSTFFKIPLNGKPLSLANAHTALPPSAVKLFDAKQHMTVMRLVSAQAPPTEPVLS